MPLFCYDISIPFKGYVAVIYSRWFLLNPFWDHIYPGKREHRELLTMTSVAWATLDFGSQNGNKLKKILTVTTIS